jgi:hypothetical protein
MRPRLLRIILWTSTIAPLPLPILVSYSIEDWYTYNDPPHRTLYVMLTIHFQVNLAGTLYQARLSGLLA